MNPWKLPKLFRKKPDWHTNINPQSKRFLTPDEMTLDPTGKESEVEVDVDSTAIKAFTWNPETHTLYITYTSPGSKEYEFPDVPESVVKALEKAPSKGRYVAKYIVPNYSINRRR